MAASRMSPEKKISDFVTRMRMTIHFLFSKLFSESLNSKTNLLKTDLLKIIYFSTPHINHQEAKK